MTNYIDKSIKPNRQLEHEQFLVNCSLKQPSCLHIAYRNIYIQLNQLVKCNARPIHHGGDGDFMIARILRFTHIFCGFQACFLSGCFHTFLPFFIHFTGPLPTYSLQFIGRLKMLSSYLITLFYTH